MKSGNKNLQLCSPNSYLRRLGNQLVDVALHTQLRDRLVAAQVAHLARNAVLQFLENLSEIERGSLIGPQK